MMDKASNILLAIFMTRKILQNPKRMGSTKKTVRTQSLTNRLNNVYFR